LLVIASIALGCDGGSQLAAPESSAPIGPIVSIESSGGQNPRVVGLYLDKMIKRVRNKCRVAPGTTAELAMTVDRSGHVAEVGMRSAVAALVPCARSELANQRLPQAKTATLIGATIQF
jgi:hypothetical protein